jgi:hypothetical protein
MVKDILKNDFANIRRQKSKCKFFYENVNNFGERTVLRGKRLISLCQRPNTSITKQIRIHFKNITG